MRIAIVTDAWTPQVNGVVRTLLATRAQLEKQGHVVEVISPNDYPSIPCPTYPEIRLAMTRASWLGARIVDRTRRIHFINVNNDHHSIALVPSKIRSLHHIAFEMPSFDALMRGVGRLRERGTNIGWGVGRHGPGNNIFAYYVGPENIPLEYTTEVAQVDETYRVGTPDDWKPIPGRMDQWGATPPPSPDMVKAEQSVEFSSGLL